MCWLWSRNPCCASIALRKFIFNDDNCLTDAFVHPFDVRFQFRSLVLVEFGFGPLNFGPEVSPFGSASESMLCFCCASIVLRKFIFNDDNRPTDAFVHPFDVRFQFRSLVLVEFGFGRCKR